jgi:hypothetical protein
MSGPSVRGFLSRWLALPTFSSSPAPRPRNTVCSRSTIFDASDSHVLSLLSCRLATYSQPLFEPWFRRPQMRMVNGAAIEVHETDSLNHDCFIACGQKVCRSLGTPHSPIRSTARGKMWTHSVVHFVLKTTMEMPPTFCRVRYFSTFLYCNGNIATMTVTVTPDRAIKYNTVLDNNLGSGTTDPQLKPAESIAIASGLGQRARPSRLS